ncbi:MAG: hypothetical protein RKP73_17115 [Candidatus Contendobacter sp.]|nr:hypothetical protein [Candidatus Contendobacter sp.]HNE34451.1 hypothetical protein [Nitrospira sp.]HNG04030.1 hypothetical protein [Nitrospira sp.]
MLDAEVRKRCVRCYCQKGSNDVMHDEPSVIPPIYLIQKSQVQRYLFVIIVAATWFFTHRYGGIWHDGVLYAAQALFRLSPNQFDGDLFFAFGSQDSFSLFAPIYALFIDLLDLHPASFLFMLVSQVLWLLSAAFLANRLCSFPANWWALLLLAILPRAYGADGIFAYAENFVTARIFAEAIALLAVGFLLHGSHRIAASALLISAVLHPIIALPAVVTAIALLTSTRQIVTITLTGIAVTLLVITVPGLPWAALAPMDADWYRISVSRSPFVFLDQWSYTELADPVYWASVLLISAAASPNPIVARCYRATVFAGVVGFALSALVLIKPVALLVQMQPWRAAWFVKVLAIVAMTELIRSTYTEHQPVPRLVCAVALACGFTPEHFGAPIAFALGICYPLIGKSKRIALITTRFQKLIIGLLVFAFLPEATLLIGDFWSASSALVADLWSGELPPKSLYFNPEPVLIAGVSGAAMLVTANSHRPPGKKLLPMFGVTLTVACAALSWSVTSTTLYVTPSIGLTSELIGAIPKGSTTYFENGHDVLWFHMKRASYGSYQQAAGVIFSRGTAIEAERRLVALNRLGTTDAHLDRQSPNQMKGATADTTITTEALRKVCEDPALGQLIFKRSNIKSSLPKPRLEFGLTLNPAKPYSSTYWLYSCQDFRKNVTN